MIYLFLLEDYQDLNTTPWSMLLYGNKSNIYLSSINNKQIQRWKTKTLDEYLDEYLDKSSRYVISKFRACYLQQQLCCQTQVY